MPDETPSPYMTPVQVGEYLSIAPETLRRWRGTNRGPKWMKMGKHVRYRKADVEAWCRSRELRTAS